MGAGNRMTYERLVNALASYGVRIPPLPEAAKTLVAGLAAGKSLTNIVIARGRRPVLAQDARVDPLGDWKYPVLPGDAIGKILPSKRGG